jgi:hypothetical protein
MYFAELGVVWVDQLWRGHPVYLIVMVPAEASTDTEIIEDLAKSDVLLGQVVAVLAAAVAIFGGWLWEGTVQKDSRSSAIDTARWYIPAFGPRRVI